MLDVQAAPIVLSARSLLALLEECNPDARSGHELTVFASARYVTLAVSMQPGTCGMQEPSSCVAAGLKFSDASTVHL